MNLIRMTIFHLKRLLKMPLILFMMIGMPVLSQWNNACRTRNGGYESAKYGRKTVAFVFEEGNDEYEELITAVYREENVYFDLDSAKEALKRGRNDRYLPSAANYFTEMRKKDKCRRFASLIRSVGQEDFLLDAQLTKVLKEVMLNAKLQRSRRVDERRDIACGCHNQMVVARQDSKTSVSNRNRNALTSILCHH